MELRHLRYFAAVAETLNFRAAAERLNLSSPGLSKQIKDLETEVGARLLDRDTTQVRLTGAGTIFLAETRAILARADQAVTLAREAASGHRGRLVVGNVGALTAGHMSACLAHYCARYPDVNVDLIDLDPLEQVPALEKRRIHVGFITAPMLASLPAGIRHVPVMSAVLHAVVARDHPLATRAYVDFASLMHERLLVVGTPRQTRHASYLESLFAHRHIKPPRMIEVQGYESLLAMIAGGRGVSILAGNSSILRVEDIVARPLREAGPDLELQLHAIWREGDGAVLAENFSRVFRELTQARKKRAGARAR